MIRIAHLVDDTTAGGVTRYLDFLRQDPQMARIADHQVCVVPRHAPARAGIDADMIVSHLAITWRGLPGLMALRARHSGLPLVHVEHSYSEGFTAANVTHRTRFHHLLRCAYALFDRVVAVSAAQAGWLERRGLVRAQALDVIPPCVDLAPCAALEAPRGPVRVLGALGRFETQKGFDVLIRAFRSLPDPFLRLALFGEGAARAELETLAAGDSRILFPGFTARPEEAYAACDAIAMPSRWEPYGLVALEANAAGRPVLMSRVDGLKDQAARGNTPVTELSEEAWTDAIARLTEAERPEIDRSLATARPTRDGWARLVEDLLGENEGERLAQTV